MSDRHLDWDGCCNVRDLGGLPTADGRVTRRGAVVTQLDVEALLRDAGLTGDDLAALRARLVGPETARIHVRSAAR